MTIERRHVGKRLSGLVIHHASGTAYLAGQVAEDPKADVSGQTRQVLALIDSLLSEAGTDKSKILSATIFLPDIGDFAAMNAVAVSSSCRSVGWFDMNSPDSEYG